MSAPTLSVEDELLREIQETPQEHRVQLLQIVREFRESVTLLSARESFRRGWHQAMTGQTHPIEELWDGIDTH